MSSINGNLPTILSEQKPETFIITALELFIHPFECEIWILLHLQQWRYMPLTLSHGVKMEVRDSNLQ